MLKNREIGMFREMYCWEFLTKIDEIRVVEKNALDFVVKIIYNIIV